MTLHRSKTPRVMKIMMKSWLEFCKKSTSGTITPNLPGVYDVYSDEGLFLKIEGRNK